MRAEAVSLSHKYGRGKCMAMTGVSQTTLSRWVAGKGGKSALSMGRRSWVQLEDPDHSPIKIERIDKPGHRKRKTRTTFSRKEEAVHRFVNEGVPIDRVVEESGASHSTIYQWRREILGKLTDPKYEERARKLEKSLGAQDRANEQMGDDAPVRVLTMSESSMRTSQGLGTVVDAPDTESLRDQLDHLGQMADSIEKDREILTLKIENENLRKQLNDRLRQQLSDR